MNISVTSITRPPEDEEQKVPVPLTPLQLDYSDTYVDSNNISEKVITKTEQIVRASLEYRKWTDYLRRELNLNECPIYPKMDVVKLNVGIEIHHYPISLYDITEAVIRKELNKRPGDSEFDPHPRKESYFALSSKVMEEHYKLNIGVVPLTTTLHELSHSRAYVVQLSDVSGDFSAFADNYGDYMSDVAKDKLDEIKRESGNPSVIARNKALLSKIVSEYK